MKRFHIHVSVTDLEQRIHCCSTLFASWPVSTLDRMALQELLDAIGKAG